ncbi:hypothetical protein [Hungatella hathewayi]|nr:hypothetical protein [Hungatella hathewayi]
MEYIWEDICSRQTDILSEVDSHSPYLSTSGGLDISAEQIREHMVGLHSRFISNIVTHFSRTYHVSIDQNTIEDKLLPQKASESRWTKPEQDEGDMSAWSLLYEDIVKLIFEQMNGRDFGEQALYELKDKCHNAAWSYLNKTAEFEIKKCVLRFACGCSYKNWYGSGEWELYGSLKEILKGIAHFETGRFALLPHGFDSLLGYRHSGSDTVEFSTCSKVSQLKMFKNGRVDIKFASEAIARQFADDYLGRVY